MLERGFCDKKSIFLNAEVKVDMKLDTKKEGIVCEKAYEIGDSYES